MKYSFFEKIKKHKLLLLSLAFFLFSSFTIQLFAAPFSAPATLNPTCAPNAVDCYVDIGGGMEIGGAITSATQGSILFAGTSGVLQQDNTSLFWNNTSNRLGIGTIAPDNILSVTPTQYSTGTASQSLTTITGVGTTFTSAMVGSQLVFADGTSAGTITAFNSITDLTVSTSQTVTSQAYNIAYTGLNVDSAGLLGLGTITPGAVLDIKSSNTNLLKIQDGSANVMLQLVGQTMTMPTNLGYSPVLNVGNSTNLGPNGSINVYGNSAGLVTAHSVRRSAFVLNSTPGDAVFERFQTNYSGAVQYGFYPATRTFLYAGTSSSTGGLIIGGNPLVFASNDVENMRIDASGNLGIGVKNPNTKFQVQGANTAGTGTVSSVTTAVTGVGTLFTTEFRVGDTITPTSGVEANTTSSEASNSRRITAIADNTNMTIDSAFSTDLSAGTTYTISTPRFVVQAGGNVGVGTASPSVQFEVKGTGTGAVIAKFTDVNNTGCTLDGGGTIACSSDERRKKNIENISYGLDTVMSLRPVFYNWKYEKEGTSRTLGFIAQEVEALIPKLVATDVEGFKSLNTVGVVPVLTKAIQELNLEVQGIRSLTDTDGTFKEKLIAWLGDVENGIQIITAKVFKSDRVETRELCVGSTCVTEEQFMQVFQSQGGGAPAPSDAPEPSLEPVPEPEAPSEPEPEPALDAPADEEPAPAPEAPLE